MNITPAPVREVFQDAGGRITPIWQDWVNSVSRMLGKSRNQQAVSWTPTFSGLTFSASGSLSGTWTQRDNVVYFTVTITPVSGTTSSVLDTTKITNLPFTAQGNWSGQAFQDSGKVDLGRCFIKDATTELYAPAWTTVSGVIYLSGVFITNE